MGFFKNPNKIRLLNIIISHHVYTKQRPERSLIKEALILKKADELDAGLNIIS